MNTCWNWFYLIVMIIDRVIKLLLLTHYQLVLWLGLYVTQHFCMIYVVAVLWICCNKSCLVSMVMFSIAVNYAYKMQDYKCNSFTTKKNSMSLCMKMFHVFLQVENLEFVFERMIYVFLLIFLLKWTNFIPFIFHFISCLEKKPNVKWNNPTNM